MKLNTKFLNEAKLDLSKWGNLKDLKKWDKSSPLLME